MIINIFEKQINKDDFGKYDDNVIFIDDKLDNYNIVVNDNIIIVNSEWYDSDETSTIALCNKVNKSIMSDIYIDLDNNIFCKDIPEFGVTLEDNFNIQQFNLLKKEIGNSETLSTIIKHRASLMYWNLDKKFNYPNKDKGIDENKIKKYISIYKKLGYIAPLVLYADKDFIRPYYHDYIIYLYKFLNLNILPIRLISYKDIKYIKNIDETIYEKIKLIPENKYYKAIDNEDMSKYMLSNYSDKRNVIKKYITKENNNSNETYKNLDIENLSEILPYIFNEEKENLNRELMSNILSHDFSKYFYLKDNKRFYNMTLSESLFNYGRGYVSTKEMKANEETIVNELKEFEIKEEIDFDPSILSLDTFDYNTNYQLSDKANSEKFGINCIYDQVPNSLIDFHSLNDILYNGAKIKILSIKET